MVRCSKPNREKGRREKEREEQSGNRRAKKREKGGMKLDEKGSKRSAGMKPEARLLEKREKPGYQRFH